MKIKIVMYLLVLLYLFLPTRQANAFIVINEILADPPVGIFGDANGDGVTSATQDEFVEILNYANNATDLSGWSLRDVIKNRHVFPGATILAPYEYLVVFGGGNPALPGIHWQVATTGTLGLNNPGDEVTLLNFDGQVVNKVIYGSEGGQDQSLARFSEGAGLEFVLHLSLPQTAGSLFSPGTSIDGREQLNAVIPEPVTLVQFLTGWVILSLVKRKGRSLFYVEVCPQKTKKGHTLS